MGYNWTETIGIPQVEDLTLYTETDPGSEISVSSTTVTYTAFQADNDGRVSYDFGASYFNSDFVHTFTVTCTDLSEAGAYVGVYALKKTDIGDSAAWAAETHIVMFWYLTGGVVRFYLREGNGDSTGTSLYTEDDMVIDGTPYYVKVAYVASEGANGTIYQYVYSDAAHTTLVSRQLIALSNAMDYRWLQVIHQFETGAAADTGTGTSSNYVLSHWGGTEVTDAQTLEMRTNINAERSDAGLAAYVWTDATIDGQDVLQTEVQELRTAIDGAYDELLTCATHYTSDDSTHYTTDKTSHDSSVCGTHYTTHDGSEYSTDDASDDGTHYTTHYVTHDATAYKTHYAAQNSSRKTNYTTGIYASGLCIFETYDKAKLRRED
jgi:hypothetical protein